MPAPGIRVMNGAGFWADLLEGPVDATVEERHAAMDRLDPHGMAAVAQMEDDLRAA